MAKIKLRILFADRVGIVAHVATLMAEQGVNILSMEVEVAAEKAIIYLEADADPLVDQEGLIASLRTLSNLEDIAVIRTLPQEKREKRFQIVLDSISDGILAVDEGGELTIINRVAREILDCQDAQAVGKNLRDLDLPDTGILQSLGGATYTNVKKTLVTDKGRFQFLASTRLIRDSAGRPVGAVEIMKDMKEVRALASAVADSATITFGDMIGESAAIREVISFARMIARTDAVVLVRGESGTGKELFAAAIHAESGRPGSFVPVNCAALPETLLESELFGYVGGAFSGAKKEGKAGLFEMAHQGTLFLDEVAEMPLSLQAKMLRVLQEKKVRRIGGSQEIPVDARVVTATNKNLEQMVKDKLFREDLYYRINVFPIHIPPLRKRLEDIPALVEHFLFHLASRLEKRLQALTADALAKLCRHDWPGNVRELRNVIERAAILCPAERIGADCILFSFEIGRGHPGGAETTPGRESLPERMYRYERQLIAEALAQGESRRQAAKSLGVSHTTLLNKLKKHCLDMERN